MALTKWYTLSFPTVYPEGYDPASSTLLHDQIPIDTSFLEDLPGNVILNTILPPFPHSENATHDQSACVISAHVKRLVLSTKGFPAEPKVPKTPAFYIAPSPGKGLGMFAARRIEVGELICDERPLLVTPLDLGYITIGVAGQLPSGTPLPMIHQVVLAEAEKSMRRVIEDRSRMTEENMRALLALDNSHLHDGSGPIMGVIRTNSFGLGEELRDEGPVFLPKRIAD